MIEIDQDYIQLKCCEYHLLHPTQFKIYSGFIGRFLKSTTSSGLEVIRLHQNKISITVNQAQKIQRQYFPVDIVRPTVEVIGS